MDIQGSDLGSREYDDDYNHDHDGQGKPHRHPMGTANNGHRSAGSDGMGNFCRKIKHPGIAAACWAMTYASEVACKKWCSYQYGD
jgi:hypothetical protein